MSALPAGAPTTYNRSFFCTNDGTRCYQEITTVRTYANAELFCEETYGGNLAFFNTQAEYEEFMYLYLSQVSCILACTLACWHAVPASQPAYMHAVTFACCHAQCTHPHDALALRCTTSCSAAQTGAQQPYDTTTTNRWWIGVKQANNVWVNEDGKRVVSYTPHFEGNATAAFAHWSYDNWDPANSPRL